MHPRNSGTTATCSGVPSHTAWRVIGAVGTAIPSSPPATQESVRAHPRNAVAIAEAHSRSCDRDVEAGNRTEQQAGGGGRETGHDGHDQCQHAVRVVEPVGPEQEVGGSRERRRWSRPHIPRTASVSASPTMWVKNSPHNGWNSQSNTTK